LKNQVTIYPKSKLAVLETPDIDESEKNEVKNLAYFTVFFLSFYYAHV